MLAAAERVLIVGIGGGGDVVGAHGLRTLLEARGTAAALAGVSWERFAVDPEPGPRTLEEMLDARALDRCGAIAGPETRTHTGVRFAEARISAHLGEPVGLIDPSHGAAAAAQGIRAVAAELDCDAVVLADVGGDVLGTGSEPGLASPLCDALMLAAGARLASEMDVLGCVVGPGCDGELTQAEVLGRVAALARADSWLGTWSLDPAAATAIERAAAAVPTEASLIAARCARGETGTAKLRGGMRSAELGPVGALCVFFDAAAAVGGLAPLAAAIVEAPSLAAARDVLAAAGVRTELDYERDRAERE